MLNNRRGQATIFIIIGILIVIIVGGLIFVNRDRISFGGLTSTQVEPVREYIRECVNEELKSLLPEMRRYGGHATLAQNKHTYNGNEYNLLNSYEGGNFLFNINFEPERTIKNNIIQLRSNHYCGVLDRFGVNLFKPYSGGDIQVTISNDKIFVTIDTPYRLGRGDSGTNVGSVDIEFENNFGRYYQIASEIVEIQNSQLNPAGKINELKTANPELTFDQDTDGGKELFGILTDGEYTEYELSGDENIIPFRFGIVTGG